MSDPADTTPAIPKQVVRRHIRDVTDEQLAAAVAHTKTYGGVCKLLNVNGGGAGYGKVIERIKALKLDTSHFTGKLTRDRGGRWTPLEQLLVAGRKTIQPCKIKTRLVNEGILKDQCVECGRGPEWRGKPLTLKLGYRNGDPHDHRLENLRVLCPNCWAQVENRSVSFYRGEPLRRETRRETFNQDFLRLNGAK